VLWFVQDGKTVVLIFGLHGSSHFHGFARVTGVIPALAAKEFIAPGVPATLQLEWWKKYVISCLHLKQPGLTEESSETRQFQPIKVNGLTAVH